MTMTTYTVRDLSERYGVGPHTVLGWIRNGLLPAINVARAGSSEPRWRITQEALDSFERLRTQSKPVIPQRRSRPAQSDIIQRY